MWKGESISHSFYVRSYQEKSMFLFPFPCVAKIFVIPSLLEGFFASHYTVCAAAQLCRYLAFSLVFCSQELETEI